MPHLNRKRLLSICGITTRDWTFEQEVVNYSAAGIDAIGIFHPKLEAIGVQSAAALLADTGLPARSMISGRYLTGTAERLAQADLDTQLRVLDDCHALGVDSLVVVPGNRYGRSIAAMNELTAEALARLAPHAQACGVTLAVEAIRAPYFDYLNTLAEAEQLIRKVNHPAIGLVFDTWHLWHEPDLYNAIHSARDLLTLAHISDWREPPRCHDDRLIPGDGSMPLADIVRFLDSVGYDGVYDVEIFSEDVWASDYCDVIGRCRSWFDSVWVAHESCAS